MVKPSYLELQRMWLSQDGPSVAHRWMALLPTSLASRVHLREGEARSSTVAAPADVEFDVEFDAKAEGAMPRAEPHWVLEIDGVAFPLLPSHWGFEAPEGLSDHAWVKAAFETVIQGHAPDYWRDTTDPMVRALGWLDRRVGKRSWRQADEQGRPLSVLEQQWRAVREHADQAHADRVAAAVPGALDRRVA